MNLKSIEKDLIKNNERLNEIEYEMGKCNFKHETELLQREEIEIEKDNKLLELKRKFILDRRNGLPAKLILITASSIITLIVTFLISYIKSYFKF